MSRVPLPVLPWQLKNGFFRKGSFQVGFTVVALVAGRGGGMHCNSGAGTVIFGIEFRGHFNERDYLAGRAVYLLYAMRYYNSRHFLRILFSLHRSDTLKVLAWPILGMALYPAGIYFLEVHYLKLTEKSMVKNLSLMHTLLAFVLSMLLVFRTNSAYDRWWEGRKLWGRLVNDSHTFAIKMSALLDVGQEEHRDFFQQHIGFFPHALSTHLSEASTRTVLDIGYPVSAQGAVKHGPIALVDAMMQRLVALRGAGVLVEEQLLFLDRQLSGFLEICGGCERIKNTPIPYSYSSFVKKFIVLYVMALPAAYVVTIGWLMIPLTVFVFYVLMSLEVIAEEIEDPFGMDENDLPMEKIAQNIERNVASIFRREV